MRNEDGINKLDQLCDLSHRLARFSPVQRKIVDFLRDNPDCVSSLTITRLAQKIGVDPASITRFCQSLGFSGYTDFRFSIARNVLPPLLWEDTLFEPGREAANRISTMGAAFQQVLNETILRLDRRAMVRAATRIATAGMVHTYAHGGASASAAYAHTLFMQIGIPCYPFSDPSLSTAAASRLRGEDVAIGISSSGTSKVSIDAMIAAKKQGAAVIAVTGSATSPMGQLADINISYNFSLKDDIRAMHMARMCEVAIFGILQMLILDTHLQDADSRLEAVQRAMKQGRYSLAAKSKPLK